MDGLRYVEDGLCRRPSPMAASSVSAAEFELDVAGRGLELDALSLRVPCVGDVAGHGHQAGLVATRFL